MLHGRDEHVPAMTFSTKAVTGAETTALA